MKKKYVFPYSHFPARMPLLLSVVLYMALDIYHAPGWLWGVAWTLMGGLWICWGVELWNQKVKPLDGYGTSEGQE